MIRVNHLGYRQPCCCRRAEPGLDGQTMGGMLRFGKGKFSGLYVPVEFA